MIDKGDNLYHLTCDICGDYESFFEFRDAVDHKKKNGWKSRRRGGEWEDVCPQCAKESP